MNRALPIFVDPPKRGNSRAPGSLDPQQVELIGRSLLVGELLRDGLEVALPERDRGIDLIAYVDGLSEPGGTFTARPIQLKARTEPAFSVHRKYERIPSLLIADIWYVQRPVDLEIYCVTYVEALAIATTMGWTKTPSWEAGMYRMNRPSVRLRQLLGPYRMGPGKWRTKVTGNSTT